MKDKEAFRRTLSASFGSVIPEKQQVPEPTEFIRSGILSLDWALGGGFPRGQISHIWGPDGAGKTMSTIPVCVEAQTNPRVNGLVLYIATEPKIDQRIFYRFGVDPDKIVFAMTRERDKPLDGNIAMDMLRLSLGEVDLIVLDSVAGLTPRVVYDMESADTAIGKVAALLSMQLPQIANITKATKTAVILLNQQRASFSQYGMETKPFAGYAIRHWIANSCWIRSAGWIKDKGTTVGFKPRLTVNKNDFGEPRRDAEWNVFWKTGIDLVQQTVAFARSMGIVTAGGGYVRLGDFDLNHPGERGAEDAMLRIREEPEVLDMIHAAVMSFSGTVEEADK